MERLLAAIFSKGTRLSCAEGKLRITAGYLPLSDDERERLRALKPEILQWAGPCKFAPASLGQEHILKERPATPICKTVSISEWPSDALIAENWKRAALRHEALRTTFDFLEGLPVQRIHPHEIAGIEFLPCSDAEEARNTACAPAEQSPETSKGPLVRIRATSCTEIRLLTVCAHRAVCDPAGLDILLRELKEPMAAGLDAQFADFAVLQRKWLTEPAMDALIRQGSSRLADADVLCLPANTTRPGGEWAPVRFTFSRPLVPSFPSSLGADAPDIALGALYTLLSRYTGQRDICIHTLHPCRDLEAFRNVIGPFANGVVLRLNLDGPSFLESIHAAGEARQEAAKTGRIPLEEILQTLPDSRSALFQVHFSYHPEGQPPVNGPLTQCDLEFHLHDRGGEIWFRQDRFSQGTVRGMGIHLDEILRQGRERPEQPVKFFRLVTGEEARDLIHDENSPLATYDEALTIDRAFDGAARKFPGRTALTFGPETWSYARLRKKANQVARFLVKKGVVPDSPVAICMQRSPWLVVGILGILKAGGAYVPIDPAYPAERIRFQLTDSGARLMVCEAGILEKMDLPPGLEPVLLGRGGTEIERESEEDPAVPVQSHHLAYVIYTSGTTGTPKGVMVEHRNVIQLLFQEDLPFHFDEEDVWTLFHSVCFDFSVWEMFGALLFGGRLVVVEKETALNPGRFLDLLESERVTVLNQVPSYFTHLAAEEGKGRPRDLALRYLIFGGEAFRPYMVKAWRRRHPRVAVVNMFGITETTVHVTFKEIGEAETADDLSNIGRRLSPLTIYVMDEDGHLAPRNVAGELVVGGAGVARGYLNRPDLTAERFLENPHVPGERIYRSGDLVRRLDGGDLEYLGRIDHQVKIRGFRVEPGEVETALASLPGVDTAFVMDREDGAGRKTLVAYLTPGPGGAPSPRELRQGLGASLPDHMIPAAFVTLDRLPLTPNGKVDRRALPEPDLSAPDREEIVPPRTETEKILCDVWSQGLGVEKVGIRDNFFELGGDSLLSIRVIAAAQARGLFFAIEELFQALTIENLAKRARQAPAGEKKWIHTRPFELVQSRDRGLLPLGIEDAYPPSRLQTSMLFLIALFKETNLYYNVSGITLRMKPEEKTFAASVETVLSRHPLLRASIDLDAYSEPLIIVHKQVTCPCTFQDLTDLSPEEQRDRIDGWFEGEKQGGFDFKKAPLFRFTLFRTSPDTCRVFLTESHVIVDGWSVATFFSEVIREYEFLLGRRQMPLPAPPEMTYRDYVAGEMEMIRSREVRDFWRDYLSDAEIGRLPHLKGPAPGIRTAGTNRHIAVALPPGITEKLHALARKAGVPLKSILLAAHLRVLQTLFNQKKVIAGIAANVRPEAPGGEGLVGLFINSLPLVFSMEPGSWLDLMARVFSAEQELLPYRWYPLSEIQGELGAQFGGDPLFDTLFNFVHFHNYHSILESEGLQVVTPLEKQEKQDFGQNEFGLMTHFSIEVLNHTLELTLSYDITKLSHEQVREMGRWYLHAMTAMTKNPESDFTSLSLLSEGERRRVLFEFNHRTAPVRPRHQGLHQFFEDQVQRTPGAVAAEFESISVTYGELNRRANRMAHYLIAQGAGPDRPIGLCMDRSIDTVTAILAVLKSGSAYVPLDPAYPAARLRYGIDHSDAVLLLTRRALLDRLPEEKRDKALCIDRLGDRIDRCPDHNPDVSLDRENLAYILYTSGSTGTPKGVAIEHRNAAAFIAWAMTLFTPAELDVTLFSTSICFDLSVFEIFAPLALGGRIRIVENILRMAGDASGPTLINTVPSALSQLIRTFRLPDSVRVVNVAGEPLRPDLVEKVYARSSVKKVYNLYGPTEDTTYSTWAAIPRGEREIPIGVPVANTRAYILDAEGRPAPMGVAGELHLAGDGLARGYFNRPELTAERFIPDPFGDQSGARAGARMYRTGDLASWSPDGRLVYLGRMDHQIKLRGYRIELGEIENRLAQLPEIGNVAATVWDDTPEDPGSRRIVAYLETAGEVPDATLREHLRETLPEYMIPSLYVRLPRLPRTPNNKIDRKALPRPEGILGVSGPGTVPPSTHFEREIAAIWQEVLGPGPVGVTDNFFDAGGNSLLLLQVYSRLKQKVPFDLKMIDLFQYPTIRALARRVEGERDKGSAPAPLSPREVGESPIAVIGMALRVPGADTPEAFWENLRKGVESIRFFSEEELEKAGVPASLYRREDYVPAAGAVEGVELFDAVFFGRTPREAALMDPQQRWFLELCWHALEHAGHAPSSGDIGVFAGASYGQYLVDHVLPNVPDDMFSALLNNNPDFLSTRVSYKLNLTGPSLSIQTACSTSLVAVHEACRSLQAGDCRMALAGGISLHYPQHSGYVYREGMTTSKDGHCRAFDRSSSGTVGGSGGGVVVLKPLRDAIADRDTIHAVILATAVNNDGSGKIGLTAPGQTGQARAIRRAIERAGVRPEEIGYVEAHGTGTRLGDPIEVAALSEAFEVTERQFCALGSVKTNIGHLDAAAGVAGLIKTVMALSKGEIPPSLHFHIPNPEIDFSSSPFYVNRVLK
ncbi:MAG: amino acid adenylation domain-containing protein, partial [Pseudomonadota bacterium]